MASAIGHGSHPELAAAGAGLPRRRLRRGAAVRGAAVAAGRVCSSSSPRLAVLRLPQPNLPARGGK